MLDTQSTNNGMLYRNHDAGDRSLRLMQCGLVFFLLLFN